MIAGDSHTMLPMASTATPSIAEITRATRRTQARHRAITAVHHASPPPGMSGRLMLLIVLAADIGWLLMAVDLRLIGGGT